MAKEYRPSEPFTVPVMLLIPTEQKVKGVTKKTYPDEGEVFFCSFKTYGGTEKVVNDVLVVEDTASVETWFRPDITGKCRIKLADTGDVYEIMGKPENINMRNKYLKFKVKAVMGGA